MGSTISWCSTWRCTWQPPIPPPPASVPLQHAHTHTHTHTHTHARTLTHTTSAGRVPASTRLRALLPMGSTAVLAVAHVAAEPSLCTQADIANALKPKAVYVEWTKRVLSEFFAQACNHARPRVLRCAASPRRIMCMRTLGRGHCVGSAGYPARHRDARTAPQCCDRQRAERGAAARCMCRVMMSASVGSR
jgi:hypothetical protein